MQRLVKLLYKLCLVLVGLFFSYQTGSLLYFSFKTLQNPVEFHKSDYYPNIVAAQLIKDDLPDKIYDSVFQLKYQKELLGELPNTPNLFRNLPLAALLYYPFQFLPVDLGYRVFYVVNIVLFVVFAVFTARRFGLTWWQRLLLMLGFLPVYAALNLGQINVLSLFIVALLYKKVKDRRSFITGLIASLLLYKANLAPIALFMLPLVRNRWRYVLGGLLGLILMFFFNSLITGPGPILYYLRYNISTDIAAMGTPVSNMYTIRPLLDQVFTVRSVQFVFNLELLYVFLTLFWAVVQRRDPDFNFSFSAALMLGLLFSFHALVQDTVLLFIPLVFAISYIKQAMTYREKFMFLLFISLILFGIRAVPWGFMFTFPALMLFLAFFCLYLGYENRCVLLPR